MSPSHTGMAFTDFEIHILESGDDGSYPVTVRVDEQDRRGSGSFRPPFNASEISRALTWMEQGLFNETFVKNFGAALFQALFTGEVLEIYQGTRSEISGALRLRLVIDAPEVARIPWELLYDPDRQVFLALEGPLVRNTSLVEPARKLEPVPVLRVLVVASFPEGTAALNQQFETQAIRQALSDLVKKGRVEIDTISHATLRKLQNALREAQSGENPRPYHVLHYIGHGQFDPRTNRALLLFEDEDGRIDEVDAASLANVLRGHDLKLVFLNACQSAQSVSLEVTQGFAPGLMSIGIPAVIGMQVSVLDEVAAQFSRDFYEALADNRPVDAALVDARRLQRGKRKGRLRHNADMGIPVCYLRSLNGQILEVEKPAEIQLSRETWWPWLKEQMRPRRVMTASLGLLTFASTLLGLYLGIQQLLPAQATSIPPMTGDFRVAVAEFTEINAQGQVVRSDDGLIFAREVYEGIDSAMNDLREAGFDIPVRPPDQTGRVEGTSTAQRAENAAGLADRHGADLVVYGLLTRQSGGTEMVLEVYLSERLLRLAEEISGTHGWASLGVPQDISANAPARRLLRDSLENNTRVLTQVIIGIGYYELDRFAEAEQYFLDAEAIARQSDDQGSPVDPEIRKLILLLLGSTAAQRKDFTRAESYLQDALDVDPNFARAQLGIANTLFLSQVNSGCLPERVNPEVLGEAERAFLRLRSRPLPPGSDLASKIALGLARVYLCMGISGTAERWEDARQEYAFILAEYERGSTRLRDLAAEAHADLGLIEIVGSETVTPSDQLRAVEEYNRAITISPHPDRQAVFYTALANTHLLIGACEQAQEALQKAEESYSDFQQANPKLRREDFEAFYQQVMEKWKVQCEM